MKKKKKAKWGLEQISIRYLYLQYKVYLSLALLSKLCLAVNGSLLDLNLLILKLFNILEM